MARGVTQHSSLKGWLGSKAPGSGGSSSSFLSGWKKKPGYVDTFMHTKMLPMSVWRHGVPIFVTVKDKQTKDEVVHVWTRKHTCHETEEVLESMYFRETKGDPTSARKHPPERCGLCKFNEWAWLECWKWLDTHDWVEEDGEKGKWVEGVFYEKDGKTKFKPKPGAGKGTDPCAIVFRLISEADDKENTTVHLGGMCGIFGRKELPDHLARAMKANKISVKEAWKENWTVKPGSVMCVVDNDNPGEGVRISEESKELGEKVKEAITTVYEGSEVDIQRTPYCIRWKFHEGAQLGKMYTATPMMKIKPSPRILKLLRGDAPDLSAITTPHDQLDMRAYLEKNCKLKNVPWDELFPDEETVKKWEAEDEAAAGDDDEDAEDDDADTDADDEDADDDSDDDEDEEKDSKADDEEDDEDEDDDEEEVACDKCEKPMPASASKCPHCGHKYDVETDDEEEEPEPPKKMKTRSELAAEKAAAKKKGSSEKSEKSEKKSSKEKPGREPGDDEEEDNNQDDEIPF